MTSWVELPTRPHVPAPPRPLQRASAAWPVSFRGFTTCWEQKPRLLLLSQGWWVARGQNHLLCPLPTCFSWTLHRHPTSPPSLWSGIRVAADFPVS